MALEEAGVALIAQGAAAYVGSLKDATNATSGFADTTDKSSGIVGRAGSMMGSAISSVASIAAGVGVAGFLALGKAIFDGVGDAREAAQLLAATEQVIKSTGGVAGVTATQVTDLATALSAASGQSLFGDSDIQAAENMLLTFTNIGKDVFPAATQATVDMAQAFHTTPEAMSMMIGKALNSAEGFTALKRSGVAFTDSQEEMIKELFATGHAAEAQKIILEELGKEFGGQAKAAADADGGMAKFKDTLGELAESVGASVLPILNDLADWLNSPEVRQGAAQFTDALIVGFDWIHDHIPPIVDLAMGVIDDLQTSLQSNASTFDTTFGSIKSIVTDAGQIIQIVLGAVAGFISDHGETIQRILRNTWTSIGAVIDIALALIQGTVKTVLQLLQGDWSGAWETVKQMSARVVTDLWTIISGGLDNLLALFQDLTGNVQQSWDDMIDDALNAGESLVEGIISGVRGMAGSLFGALKQMAQDAYDSFMAAIKGGSPAKEFEPAGQSIVQGIMEGFSNTWPALTDMIGSISGDLIDDMKSIGRDMQDAIADSFGATANIDRQMAKNFSRLKDVSSEFLQDYIQQSLAAQQKVAEEFADPKAGAAYFKMVSDNIFETAALQKKIDEATSQREKDQLQAQLILISRAQDAEMEQFRANQAGQQSTTEQLADSINAIMAALAGINLTDDQIQIVSLLSSIWGTLQTPIQTASPPASAQQMAAQTNTTNYYGPVGPQMNMPVYTNNTPGAIQQSWAVMQASMP